jgi:hypothetical protein
MRLFLRYVVCAQICMSMYDSTSSTRSNSSSTRIIQVEHILLVVLASTLYCTTRSTSIVCYVGRYSVVCGWLLFGIPHGTNENQTSISIVN